MTQRSRLLTIWLRSSAVLLLVLTVWGTFWTPASASSAAPSHAVSKNLGGPHLGALGEVPNCLQAPPQAVKDRATYTAAELALYGLPPRTPGEPLAKWQQIVRSAGKRVCSYHTSSDQFTTETNSKIWAGNMADESSAGQVYTETDLDYYVSCISTAEPPGGDNAMYSAWVGLGGHSSGVPLVQTGFAGFREYSSLNGWQNFYYTWVEDSTAGGNFGTNIHADYLFGVNCGDHMYVKAWNTSTQGCVYIERINDGVNSGDWCGNKGDQGSAEAIVELNPDDAPYLADFGTETFYGVGITDNGVYHGMDKLPHEYFNLYLCVQGGLVCTWGPEWADTGPITYDSGDPPCDEYSVTRKNPY